MSWIHEHARLEALGKSIDPAVKLVTKEHFFWKALSWVLFCLSGGMIKHEKFLLKFATTIGPLQAFPSEWSVKDVERVVVHESQHTRQARFFGLGIHPILGIPLNLLVYGFLFFPIGLAYFRYRLELAADKASWKSLLRNTDWTPDEIRERANDFAITVTSWMYFKTWPRKWAVKGFQKAAEEVIKEYEEENAQI